MHDLLTAWLPYGSALGWGVYTLVDELVSQHRRRIVTRRDQTVTSDQSVTTDTPVAPGDSSKA